MYRLYSAVAVLAAAIVISVLGYECNTHTAKEVSDAMQYALHYFEMGEVRNAERSIFDAKNTISSNRNYLYLFVCHDVIDEIERCVEKAEVCLAQNDKTLFSLYCSNAINLTKDFEDLQYPNLSNII